MLSKKQGMELGSDRVPNAKPVSGPKRPLEREVPVGPARYVRLRVTLPDFHRAIQFVGDFQNFQLEILVERLRAQKGVDRCLSFGGVLTSDKRVQPAQEKKDFAFPLDLRQGFERRFQKRQRQLGLVPVVKRSQALLDPVLRARGNV